MHTAMRTPDGRSAVESGAEVLRQRVLRVAQAGRLRVSEHRAVELIRAAGTGVVFTLIDQPEDGRDESLADLAWEAVCATILTGTHTAAPAGPIAAAVTFVPRYPTSRRSPLPSARCSATGWTASPPPKKNALYERADPGDRAAHDQRVDLPGALIGVDGLRVNQDSLNILLSMT